jgi:hypothetical protein
MYSAMLGCHSTSTLNTVVLGEGIVSQSPNTPPTRYFGHHSSNERSQRRGPLHWGTMAASASTHRRTEVAATAGKRWRAEAAAPTARRPRVFGVGLSRSGTHSLAAALNQLGLWTVHYPDPAAMLGGIGPGIDILWHCLNGPTRLPCNQIAIRSQSSSSGCPSSATRATGRHAHVPCPPPLRRRLRRRAGRMRRRS